jgi:hypothetical protein
LVFRSADRPEVDTSNMFSLERNCRNSGIPKDQLVSLRESIAQSLARITRALEFVRVN